MKKSTAVTIIAILAAIIVLLGILFAVNQKKNADQISSLNAEAAARSAQLEELQATLTDQESSLAAQGGEL